MCLKVILVVTAELLLMRSRCDGLELHDFTAEAISNDIMERLGVPDYKERLSVEKLPGITDIFDEYISTDEALQNCEEGIVDKVEKEIQRLRAIAVEEFFEVGRDLEKRCRSYAEFGLGECRDRVDKLATQLKSAGKQLFTDNLSRCRLEVIDVAENKKDSEEVRLRAKGEDETKKFEKFYTDRGKSEERKIRNEFKEKEKVARKQLEDEFKERGKQVEELIRKEYELRGEMAKMEINQTTTIRGLQMMDEIKKEFEERGERLKKQVKKEFEQMGEKRKKEVEKEFRVKGEEVRKNRTAQCKRMINEACENVILDTFGDDTCLDLDFALDGGKRRKRKVKKPTQKPRHRRMRGK